MTTAALPTTDTLASDTDRTLQDVLNDATSAAETALIAAYPVLADPGLEQIWEFVFNEIAGKIGGAAGTLSGFIVVDLQKYTALKTAATALTELKAAQSSGDQNAITIANVQTDAAAAAILHYMGSVSS
jgi:hypothetical protein